MLVQMLRTSLLSLLLVTIAACSTQNSLLKNNIQGEQRTEQNRQRDAARHPLQEAGIQKYSPLILNRGVGSLLPLASLVMKVLNGVKNYNDNMKIIWPASRNIMTR